MCVRGEIRSCIARSSVTRGTSLTLPVRGRLREKSACVTIGCENTDISASSASTHSVFRKVLNSASSDPKPPLKYLRKAIVCVDVRKLTAPTRSPQAEVVASDEAQGGVYDTAAATALCRGALRRVVRSLIQRHGCVMLRKAFVTVEGTRTVSSVGPCRKKFHWWRFVI